MDKTTSPEDAVKIPPGCIQSHYIVAAMVSSAAFFSQLYLGIMSVTIVAMTMKNKSETSEELLKTNTTTICPDFQTENSSNRLTTDFNWTKEEQGIILAMFMVGFASTQILGGYIAQQFSAKLTAGLSTLICGILCLIIPIVATEGGVWAICVVRLIQGLLIGTIMSSNIELSARWYPKRELGWLSTLIATMVSLGTVFGSISAGLLCDYGPGGWRSVFYSYGAVSIPWFLCWCRGPQENFL